MLNLKYALAVGLASAVLAGHASAQVSVTPTPGGLGITGPSGNTVTFGSGGVGVIPSGSYYTPGYSSNYYDPGLGYSYPSTSYYTPSTSYYTPRYSPSGYFPSTGYYAPSTSYYSPGSTWNSWDYPATTYYSSPRGYTGRGVRYRR